MKHSIKLHVKQVPLCAGSDVTWTQPAAAHSVHPAAPRIRCAPVWPLANRPDAHRRTESCTAVSSVPLRACEPTVSRVTRACPAGLCTRRRGHTWPCFSLRGVVRHLEAAVRRRACTCEGPPGRATCGGCGLGAHVSARARWGCCRLPPPPTPCLALQRCGDPLRRPGAGEPGQAPSNCPGGSAHGRGKQCFRQRLGAAVPNLCGTGPQPLWHRHQGPGPL